MGSRSGFSGSLRARLIAAASHAAEGFFVGFVGGGAGGAAIHNGADGNAEGVLGDVLVDGVVGEAGERVDRRVNFDFGFVRVAPADDAVGDVLEFRRTVKRAPLGWFEDCGCGSASRSFGCRFFLGSLPFLRFRAHAASGALKVRRYKIDNATSKTTATARALPGVAVPRATLQRLLRL